MSKKILLITVLLLFCSCSMLQDYRPDSVQVEYRYNPSWGFYRHAYYRPVIHDWRWTYRQPYCPPKRTVVRSKVRRGHVSNKRETRATGRRDNRQK